MQVGQARPRDRLQRVLSSVCSKHQRIAASVGNVEAAVPPQQASKYHLVYKQHSWYIQYNYTACTANSGRPNTANTKLDTTKATRCCCLRQRTLCATSPCDVSCSVTGSVVTVSPPPAHPKNSSPVARGCPAARPHCTRHVADRTPVLGVQVEHDSPSHEGWVEPACAREALLLCNGA